MTTQTSVNNKFTNTDVDVYWSNSGGDVKTTVQNTNNTSTSSRAYIKLSTGGASGGDPKVVNYTGAEYYSYGIDNSDSDAFTISNDSALGTSNIARCSTNGAWNYPQNSSFSAYINSSTVSNVSGNGTTYTMPFSSTYYNVDSDYNTGTYTYTAPRDGIYLFTVSAYLKDASTCTQCKSVIIVNSSEVNAAYQGHGAASTDPASIVSAVIELDQGDTVVSAVRSRGEASDRHDLYGYPSYSWFTGALTS